MIIQSVNEGPALCFFRHLDIFKAVSLKNYASWRDDGEARAYYVTDEAGNTCEIITGPACDSFASYWARELELTYQNWTANCLGKLRRGGVERCTSN